MAMMPAGCPSRQQLSQYVLGTLEESSADGIADHLDRCPDCEATLDHLETAADTVIETLRRGDPHDVYTQEPGFRRAESLVDEIGRDLTSDTVVLPTPAVADLGDLGQYKLLAKLGQGGMGAVYKALHTRLRRVVALKVLPADRLTNPEAVARFDREMQAVGKLNHQNIVAAHDAGEVQGMHYLVMELVEGIDLSKLVRQVGPLNVPDACEIIRQAAEGLAHAHQHGMVHRDIKPSNIVLSREHQVEMNSRRSESPASQLETGSVNSARVKLLDFGLALLDDRHLARGGELTGTGQMMGTLDYMAPEQGTDTHGVDIRADIYSLGATLFKLLTAETPFSSAEHATPLGLMMAKATKDAPSIATRRDDLPAELVRLVDRMLARDPDHRPATPEEVATQLAPLAQGADLKTLAARSGDRATTESSFAAGLPTPPSFAAGLPTPPHSPSAGHPPSAAVARSGDRAGTNASSSRRSARRWKWFLAASAAAGILLLAAVTLIIRTNRGTIVVEVDDPNVQVRIGKGEQIVIDRDQDSGGPIELRPGDYTLHIRRGDLEFETNKFRLRRGDKVAVSVKLLDGQVQVMQDGKLIGSIKPPEGTAVEPSDIVAFPPAPGTSPPDTDLPLADYALQFDGKGAVVAQFPFVGKPREFTVEGYINTPMKQADYVRVVHLGDEVGIGLVVGKFGWEFRPYLLIANTIPTGSRVHFAGVCDSQSWRLYLNGKLAVLRRWGDDGNSAYQQRPVPSLPEQNFGGPLKIGAPGFEGTLDEVRISDVCRYADNFQPARRFEPDEHTLALYHFDEGAGDVLRDASGNGRHGKITAAKWVPAGSKITPGIGPN